MRIAQSWLTEILQRANDGWSVSPAELDARRAVEKVRAAQASIETDPVVRAFREQFGANPRPGSIHPLDS